MQTRWGLGTRSAAGRGQQARLEGPRSGETPRVLSWEHPPPPLPKPCVHTFRRPLPAVSLLLPTPCSATDQPSLSLALGSHVPARFSVLAD